MTFKMYALLCVVLMGTQIVWVSTCLPKSGNIKKHCHHYSDESTEESTGKWYEYETEESISEWDEDWYDSSTEEQIEVSTEGSHNKLKPGVVNSVDEDIDLLNKMEEAGSKLVVVMFFTQSSKDCTKFAPVLDKIAKDNPKVVFLSVDLAKIQFVEFKRKIQFQKLPMIAFVKGGKDVGTRMYGGNEKLLLKAIEKLK